MFIFKMCKQTTVILSTNHLWVTVIPLVVLDAHPLTTLCLPQFTRRSLANCCQVVSIS